MQTAAKAVVRAAKSDLEVIDLAPRIARHQVKSQRRLPEGRLLLAHRWNDLERTHLRCRAGNANFYRSRPHETGLHSKAIRNAWQAEHQERIILNMHKELDQYLRC